jgi:hypothetical protein
VQLSPSLVDAEYWRVTGPDIVSPAGEAVRGEVFAPAATRAALAATLAAAGAAAGAIVARANGMVSAAVVRPARARFVRI